MLAHSVPVQPSGAQRVSRAQPCTAGCYSLPLAPSLSGHSLTKLLFSCCCVSFQKSVPKVFARTVLFLAGTGSPYLYWGGAKRWHVNLVLLQVHSGGKTMGDSGTHPRQPSAAAGCCCAHLRTPIFFHVFLRIVQIEAKDTSLFGDTHDTHLE